MNFGYSISKWMYWQMIYAWPLSVSFLNQLFNTSNRSGGFKIRENHTPITPPVNHLTKIPDLESQNFNEKEKGEWWEIGKTIGEHHKNIRDYFYNNTY